MHPKDELLRGLVDQELSNTLSHQVREHLSRCPACQSRMSEMQRQAGRVRSSFDTLSPGPRDLPRTPQSAYRRFAGRRSAGTSRLLNQQKEPVTMFTKRPLWTALAVLAVVAVLFSLTPVQAWASSFLSLFRVQKITVVQFDPSAAEGSRAALNSNRAMIEQVFEDDLKINEKGERQSVASAAEAASAAGFTPRLPAEGQPVLAVQPGFNAEFTIDQPRLQELMEAVGVDAELPASVNGKVATADVSSLVSATYNCPDGQSGHRMYDDCTVLLQVPSPVVTTPEGLDVPRLGQALFQFLGMPVSEAEQLSQKIDWATTLVLPVPQGTSVEYQEVQVDGVSGTLLTNQEEPGYMLMWVKDGIIYSLRSPGSVEEGLSLANSLK